MLQKIFTFIKYRWLPSYNMYEHQAEQYYFQQYFQHIEVYMQANKTLLDVGCQYGRFTIPALQRNMYVWATDLNNKYKKYIEKKCFDKLDNFHFKKETIRDTIERTNQKFDIVICTELLYFLENWEQNLKGLASLVKEDGYLITSHRTIGYYIYRFLKEKKFDEIEKILKGNHPQYNAQTYEQIFTAYKKINFQIEKIFPVGCFSGFMKDPFATIIKPHKLNGQQKKFLFELETNEELIKLFANNARYLCVIAKKKTL